MVNGSGLSAARLQRMHDVLGGHVERGGLTGLVTLIARHGEVHADGIGTLTSDGAVPGADTIFRIASMSKPVAAVAAMILVEECPAPAGRPGRRAAAGAGGPAGAASPGRAAGGHGAGRAADPGP